MSNITTIAKNLNKLFVKVPGTVDIASIVTTSQANQKKIYFVESKNTIVVDGVKYGLDPSTAEDITKLQTLIGAQSIEDASALNQSIISRLVSLENVSIGANSRNYLKLNDVSAGTSPVLDAHVVAIDDPTLSSSSTGLVDAAATKAYLDVLEARATTEVAVGKGLAIVDNSTNSGPHEYVISPDLKLAYVNETAGSPSKIVLSSADDASIFSEVNVSDIIGDGILQDSSYNKESGILTLYFKNSTADSSSPVSINLSEMLDINDVFVNQDSSKYLSVDLTGEENSQAEFRVLTQDPSTATAQNTGLADAWQVKQYVDSQSSDLAVTAQGDDYIDASVLATDNKNVRVAAKLATVEASNAAATTYTVADNGTISGSEVSHTLTVDTSNAMLSAGNAVASIKQYVDEKAAEERAYANAQLLSKIKSLDSEDSAGTNVVVDVSIVDGKIADVSVLEKYATVTGTRAAHDEHNDTDASLVVTNGSQLVTGDDVTTLVNYIEDRLSEETGDLEVKGLGDSYISAVQDDVDNKQIDVSANISNLSIDGLVLKGDQGKLMDASQAAATITTFVDGRLDASIAEAVESLDSSITFTDSSAYVAIKINEVDGKLTSTDSSLSVVYGNLYPGAETATAPGIATTQNVQDFVDRYDFWETYTAPTEP